MSNDRSTNGSLLAEIREEMEQVLDDDERQLTTRAQLAEPQKRLAHAFLELDESLSSDGELPHQWAHAKNGLVTPTEAASTIERLRAQFGRSFTPAESAALADAERALRRLSETLGVP